MSSGELHRSRQLDLNKVFDAQAFVSLMNSVHSVAILEIVLDSIQCSGVLLYSMRRCRATS